MIEASRALVHDVNYPIGFRYEYDKTATVILKTISGIVRLEMETRGGFRPVLLEYLPIVLVEIAIAYLDGKSILQRVLYNCIAGDPM
jgi:hypothetical protein